MLKTRGKIKLLERSEVKVLSFCLFGGLDSPFLTLSPLDIPNSDDWKDILFENYWNCRKCPENS